MRGQGGGGGCKPGNSNAMIRSPLPTHRPKSRQRRAPRRSGEAGQGERRSHSARVSRGTGVQAGGLRGEGEGVRGCHGGARARGGGSLAPALLRGGGGTGTQAGEPETASQFIYKPVPTALPPARHTRRRRRLLPPPRSHRPLPAAPASARTSQARSCGPSAARLLHASRGGAASSRPAGAPPSPQPPPLRAPRPRTPGTPGPPRCGTPRAPIGAELSPGGAEVGGKGEGAGYGVSLCFSWPPPDLVSALPQ